MAPKRKTSSKKKAKVLKSRVVYRAPVFYVTSETVQEPSGVTARRDIIRHPGSVVIMPVDDTGKEPKVLLIRQFRYAAGEELWELSAGRVDPGETLLEGAKRELTEETGYSARKWTKALYYYASPGFMNETMTIFMARELKKGVATPEEDEVIRSKFFPLSTATKMVMSGKIIDGKTIAGILWLDRVTNRS